MSESEIYDLLNLAEDFFLDGFRQDHPPLSRTAAKKPHERPEAAKKPHEIPEAAETVHGGSDGQAQAEAPQSSGNTLVLIAQRVAGCTSCALHQARRQTVPGEGSAVPLVMVIGEGPGAEEDRSGRPFVGRAGQYLDRWLAAVGLDRNSNCFIGNIVKCRPPGNRDPLPEESAACLPYLEQQVDVLKPKAILAVGRIATQILCGRTEGIGQLRGIDLEYRGIPLVATYHPSAVLRNTELRAPVWQDLKRLRALPVLRENPGLQDPG